MQQTESIEVPALQEEAEQTQANNDGRADKRHSAKRSRTALASRRIRARCVSIRRIRRAITTHIQSTTTRRRVMEWERCIRVRLQIQVTLGEVLALADALQSELGVVAERRVERVADGEVHCDFIEIVLEDDEAGIDERRVAQNALEGVEGCLANDVAAGDLPVVGVEFDASGRAGPHDGNHAHGKSDGTDTVVDVTVRRAHGSGGDTEEGLDCLASPAEFSNNLLVGEVGQRLLIVFSLLV